MGVSPLGSFISLSQKSSIPSLIPLLTNPPTPASWPWYSPILGHRTFTGPRASPPIDDQLGHPLLHMQLETLVTLSVSFGWWFSPSELWGYWLLHIVVPKPFSSLSAFSSYFIGDPVLCSLDSCEHPLLNLSGTSIASQDTAISGSCQKAHVGIHNSVWVW